MDECPDEEHVPTQTSNQNAANCPYKARHSGGKDHEQVEKKTSLPTISAECGRIFQ